MPELIAVAVTGPRFVDELQRAWETGNAVFPLDQRLPIAQQQKLLRRFGAAVLVDQDGAHTRLEDGFPVEDDDALVVASSGTTSEPKGVVHTHASVLASAEQTSEAMRITEHDHWLACLPVAHIGGLSVVTRALLTDTPLTVHAKFDADAVTDAAHNGATLVSLVTAALHRIDPKLFRAILLGGAQPPAVRPVNTIATYGMTETGSGIVYDTKPLRDVEIRIGSDGEIEVKSPTMFRCYRDGTDPKVDDWFATGDAGEIDGGVLRVHGRFDEVINTGGEKVWPTEVEAVLRDHPLIDDVRVLGEPDREWGEIVVAEIRRTEGNASRTESPSLEQLRDLVKKTLPAYCAPRKLRMVGGIERTATGKIRRPGRIPKDRP